MKVEAHKTGNKEMLASQKQELIGTETTRPGRVFTPAVDIFETEQELTLLVDMPGVTADGLTIDLRDSRLTIEGRVREAETRDERTLLREYDTGSFHRGFQLSNAIDQERIDAALTHGVLRLRLPKAEAARPRTIEVRAD